MSAPPPRQILDAGLLIAGHRHEHAYLTVVLDGGYEEAGDYGRRRLSAGDVVVHGLFSFHRNSVTPRGAVVLNLPVQAVSGGFGRIGDLDAVARLAARDPLAAAQQVREQLMVLDAETLDWPDELARDLGADPQLSLGDWAAARGLAAETLSRGFGRVFGLSPKRYRHEVKLRGALHGAIAGREPLAQVALGAGFADQAQMSRAITALTGASPGAWRRSSGDKTGG